MTLTKTSLAKDKVQKQARAALKKAHGTGLVAMCTGSGKTKVGVDEVVDTLTDRPGKALWIVPYEKLRDKTVEAEFEKWAPGGPHKSRLDIICYASIKNVENQEYSVVILDEAHNLTLPRAIDLFTKNKVQTCIALTATPPHEKEKKFIFNKLGIRTVYSLRLDEGVKLGVVAPYEVKQINIPMSAVETAEYTRISNQVRRAQFGRTGRAKFLYMQRARFIYNLRSKTEFAKKMLSNISQDQKLIGFCGSIKQAEELFSHTFHSKTDGEDFDAFIDGKLDRLGVVNAVNEGHNIPDLDIGLVIQLNSNPRHTMQRIGRFVRYRPDHKAKIFILVAEGTKDEDWARKALVGVDPANIEYLDYKTFL